MTQKWGRLTVVVITILLVSLTPDGQQATVKALLPPYLPLAGFYAGWEEVGTGSASGGGISNNSGDSRFPWMAIAPDGTHYVTWHDDSSGDYEIYVRRWNGSSWVEVGSGSASGGGISNNSGDSRFPVLAFATDGTSYITWQDDSNGNNEIYIRRWSGSNWVQVGVGSASGGGISHNDSDSRYPRIDTGPDGKPCVIWQDDSDGDWEIYVRRWSGSLWAEVGAGSASGGGISHNGSDSIHPSIAVAPDGTPYAIWRDNGSGDNEAYVRRWNGNWWEEIGAGSASGGGISNNNGSTEQPSIVFTPDGTPYAAWRDDDSGDYEVYVRRWNGVSWEEVGTDSASGGGISHNSGTSRDPSLAIGLNGTPYIAWEDNSSGDYEIYARCWSGTSWQEVGASSASGGGISDNGGNSARPSIAIAPNGTSYIAWSDNSSGDYEIYVRRWKPRTYLPIVSKPVPSRVYITNNTGGSLTYEIPAPGYPGPPEGQIRCVVPAGAVNYFCDRPFTPGTYYWKVTGICGTKIDQRTYLPGDNFIPAFYCK